MASEELFERRPKDCACYHWWVTLGAVCYMVLLGVGCSARSGASKAAAGGSGACTNPVYAASMPDPSVIRHKGFYYAFGTTRYTRTISSVALCPLSITVPTAA